MADAEFDDPPLRPTGLMERFNIIRNHVKFYNNILVTAKYSIPRTLLQHFGNDEIEGLVYAALKETLNHQPMMGVTIEDEGTKEPKWIRLRTINLREVVKFINADPNASPDKWVQDTHRTSPAVTGELPLWRVVIASQDSAFTEKGSHVMLAVGFFGHHAIADGLSCGAFHLTFLEALNTLHASSGNASVTSDAIVAVPKLTLVPNLEMKATLSVSILFVLVQIFKAFVYNPVDPLNWSGPLISPNSPRPPIGNTRSFSLPPTLASKLVARCRAEKTTITALVTVLTARKLAILYPEYKRFTGNIPFSLRKFTCHTPKDMGVFISNVTPYFSSEAKPSRGYISCAYSQDEKLSSAIDEKLWESARAVKQFIEQNTATSHNQHVNMLKFVSDYKGYFLGLLGTKRAHAFEVMNIGVVDGGAGGDAAKASFDRVMFSAGGCVFGDPYAIFLATAKNGYMTVAVGWQSSVVSDEEAKDMLGWLEMELKGLVEE